jgi:hypothetical protein
MKRWRLVVQGVESVRGHVMYGDDPEYLRGYRDGAVMGGLKAAENWKVEENR